MTGQELKTSWLPWVGGWWAEEGDGGDAWFRLGNGVGGVVLDAAMGTQEEGQF